MPDSATSNPGALSAAEVAYLFESLPFSVRHYFGGDAREFVAGVRAAIGAFPASMTQERMEYRLRRWYGAYVAD